MLNVYAEVKLTVLQRQKVTRHLFNQAGHVERCEWRLLGHFHHHRVAGGQSRGDLPGLHQQREVPLQEEKGRNARSKRQ